MKTIIIAPTWTAITCFYAALYAWNSLLDAAKKLANRRRACVLIIIKTLTSHLKDGIIILKKNLAPNSFFNS